MINAKGETIYTSVEIAYELGISPATVNAVGRRIWGCRIPHWTLNDVQLIVKYIKSISIEEDGKRLAVLHDTIQDIMSGEVLDAAKAKRDVEVKFEPPKQDY